MIEGAEGNLSPTSNSRLSAGCRDGLVSNCELRIEERRHQSGRENLYSAEISRAKIELGSGGVLRAMQKKWYLKDEYADFPPTPFAALDYVLCAIVFLLIGIASNAQFAGLVASMHK
jgi:hypothetical protein